MNDDLIYNRNYKLWRDGEFIGVATWTNDNNIGDAFISLTVDKKYGMIREVYQADKWELMPESPPKKVLNLGYLQRNRIMITHILIGVILGILVICFLFLQLKKS